MKKLMLSLFILLSVSILSTQAQNDSIAKSLELTPKIIEKLSSDQILELAKEKEKLKYDKEMAVKGMELPQKLIKEMMPSGFVMIISSLFFFAFLLMLVIIPFYFNQRKSKARLNLLGKFIDKDKDIPKELMLSEKKTRSDLHRAIILISLGLSVGLFLYLLKLEENYWTIGLIPTIIGMGYFLSFKFANTNKPIQE